MEGFPRLNALAPQGVPPTPAAEKRTAGLSGRRLSYIFIPGDRGGGGVTAGAGGGVTIGGVGAV